MKSYELCKNEIGVFNVKILPWKYQFRLEVFFQISYATKTSQTKTKNKGSFLFLLNATIVHDKLVNRIEYPIQ